MEKTMKSIYLGLAAMTFITVPVKAEQEKPFDLVQVCKTDCPKAKNNEEAHSCAEKIGRLNKEFRKSKCWDENEKYEAEREKKQK